MQLRPEQLDTHLQDSLAPVYLLHGDEPLIVQESADAIRARARALGFSERQVLHAESGFDWNALQEAGNSLSLFAEQRIIEVRMPGGKPGDAGGKALRAYAGRPAEDTLLMVICGKLEAAQRKAKWVTELDRAGVQITCWPVDARALPGWIETRMRKAGFQPTPGAVQLLAERVEGNLLAAAQEIDKLALLHGAGPVDEPTVAAQVSDSARFDVFGLVDSALEGQARRCLRMLEGLRAEGVEAVIISWALARELRSLARMAFAMSRGETAAAVMNHHKVWRSRQPLIGKALRRYRLPAWQALLRKCAEIDRIVKGQAPGNAWDELLQLCLGLSGARLGLTTRQG